MKITVTPNPNHGTLPASDKLGFGTVFTDHMFLMDYTDCDGWHNARIVPFGPISVSPPLIDSLMMRRASSSALPISFSATFLR